MDKERFGMITISHEFYDELIRIKETNDILVDRLLCLRMQLLEEDRRAFDMVFGVFIDRVSKVGMSMTDQEKKLIEAVGIIQNYCNERDCCRKCFFDESDDDCPPSCLLHRMPLNWVFEV